MLILRIFILVCLMMATLLGARVEWESFKSRQNFARVNQTLSIRNESGRQVLDSDVDFLQDVSVKLTIKIDIFQINGQKKQLLLAMPKFNYCDYRRGLTTTLMGVFQTFVEAFYKFGNLTQTCPFKKGYYYMRDVIIDGRNMPVFLKLKTGKFLFRITAADESSVRVKSWLATNDFYVNIFA